MFDYNEFVSKSKSLLIAPAGYGKTHTVAECLKYTDGKQLILTHTHAGVASLKEKIKKNNISSDKFNVETIDSFAQKFVLAFYRGEDIPEQENSKEYFQFVTQKATYLVKLNPIKNVIKASYKGIFVDEYQDCTINQHRFMMALSNLLQIHILGDPLQGIYGFSAEDRLVDWETDLREFDDFRFELTEAWRWKNKNSQLGSSLMEIREKLKNRENIDLSLYETVIETLQIIEHDIYSWDKQYNREIRKLLNTATSLLIIHPDSQNIHARKKIIKTFQNRLYLVEAMDGKDFYELSKIFDTSNTESTYNKIHKVIYNIFNKSELDKWFNNNGLKNKQKEADKKLIAPIKANLDSLNKRVCFGLVSKTLKQIKKLPSVKCYRKELFSDLCRALEQAEYQDIYVYEAMVNIKNMKRRIGRKIEGKCLGTTLLTKGLEFDTVAVLNAHKFTCPKNLYVALTRASKKLVVFTNNKNLMPYA
ncbi:MAG: AAA family ATPase [Bacteroidetes bacterium]|nr:AAA family ATPase [Bacteroidota bacterium]